MPWLWPGHICNFLVRGGYRLWHYLTLSAMNVAKPLINWSLERIGVKLAVHNVEVRSINKSTRAKVFLGRSVAESRTHLFVPSKEVGDAPAAIN